MKNKVINKVEALQPSDLQVHPVWEFINDARQSETAMRPVERLPVERLGGLLVGTLVHLANGATVWGLLANVDDENPQLNEHLVTLMVERNGKWFHLARYHDRNYVTNGPLALANFLGMSADDVFPISYDIRPYSKGVSSALVGSIKKEPSIRLDRAELIKLSVRHMWEQRQKRLNSGNQ